MKRSRSISLVLMGTLALGAGGCNSNQEEEFAAFTSVDECSRSGAFSTEDCRDAAVTALKENPLFTSQASCEQEFGVGNCGEAAPHAQVPVATSNSTVSERRSGWSPFLTGFLISRFMGGGGYMQSSQPLYKAPQEGAGSGRNFRTRGGETVRSDLRGKVDRPSAALKQSATHRAKPVTGRGGASSQGGFSGGKKFGGSSGS